MPPGHGSTTKADAHTLRRELKRKAEQLKSENREEEAQKLLGTSILIAGTMKQNNKAPDQLPPSDQPVSNETKKEMEHAQKLLDNLDLDQ